MELLQRAGVVGAGVQLVRVARTVIPIVARSQGNRGQRLAAGSYRPIARQKLRDKSCNDKDLRRSRKLLSNSGGVIGTPKEDEEWRWEAK